MEWDYLLDERSDADQLVGVARIQLGEKIYANGLVLLPDNWTCPVGVTFKSGFSNTHSVQAYADYQTFTLADWQQLEAAGAVFLPVPVSAKGRLWATCRVAATIGLLRRTARTKRTICTSSRIHISRTTTAAIATTGSQSAS